jgi:hypothetical protein
MLRMPYIFEKTIPFIGGLLRLFSWKNFPAGKYSWKKISSGIQREMG